MRAILSLRSPGNIHAAGEEYVGKRFGSLENVGES